MLLSEFLKDQKNSQYMKTRDWQDPNNQNKTRPFPAPEVGYPTVPIIKCNDLPTIEFQGLQIAIENEVGSTREGTDKDGNKWSTTFSCPYGYILNTLGRDNEEVDVYIGKNKKSDKVFIVRQHIDGLPDEDKTFVGFDSPDQVKECYLSHMSKPDSLHKIIEMPMSEFKKLTIK